MSLHLRSDSAVWVSEELSASSTNPAWNSSMPSWNLTTDCRDDWSKDYHPCPFPYTGLSGYSPDATHCDVLFSESFPDAYLSMHVFFLVANSIIFLICVARVVCSLVDTGYMPIAFINKMLGDPNFKRSPKPNIKKPGAVIVTLNVYDYCNSIMLVTSILQIILACDIEGWSNLIPYKVTVTIGIISQNVAVMSGIPITVNWMNLIHVWSDPLKNRNSRPTLGIVMRNTAIATMWLVSFPITFSALFITGSCNNGCENGSLSCIGKIVFSFVLFTTVMFAVYYAFQIYLVLKSDDEFNIREFLCPHLMRRRGESTDTKAILAHSNTKHKGKFSSSDNSNAEEEENEERKIIVWDRIRKIWKIVAFSICVSIAVIFDNFSYCFGRYGTIKYESPPCSAYDTVFNLKMMWFMFGGTVIFLMLVPHRQRKQSAKAKKVLVDRIKHNKEVAMTENISESEK